MSQQSADEKQGDALAVQAEVTAQRAHLDRLRALETFKRLTAPFDGVVIARNTDVGALINSGSASPTPLFKVADMHAMRVYVRVPQAYANALATGLRATLTEPQYPGQTFEASLTSTSQSVAQESRTVLAELLAPNPKGQLWAGTFAEVTFQLPGDPSVLRVPASALIFRSHGPQLATVGADNHVVMKDVTVGKNLGTEIEIQSGITREDRVIVSPLDTLEDGELVDVPSSHGGCGCVRRGRKAFFFEKKNQKTFTHSQPQPPCSPAEEPRRPKRRQEQKFFGSFFQKRTPCCLRFRPLRLRPGPQIQSPAHNSSRLLQGRSGIRDRRARMDGVPRGAWWVVFGDLALDALEARVDGANPTLAAALAALNRSRALAAEARAGLFPTLSVGGHINTDRQSNRRPTRGLNQPNQYLDNAIDAQAHYEVDLWDRVANSVKAGRAAAQASAADLETIRLSLHAELASDYIDLRGLDAQAVRSRQRGPGLWPGGAAHQ